MSIYSSVKSLTLGTALVLLISITTALPGIEEGYASWYGTKFHGRTTANGEVYDMYEVTAAHKSLPFGTVVKVTDVESGEYVFVRINDRGPFVKGRIIDLSRAAAEELEMIGRGIIYVTLEIHEEAQPPPHLTLQVGAFREARNISRVGSLLENAGYEVFLEETGTGVTRILIQKIDTLALEETRIRLKALGFPVVLVRRPALQLSSPNKQNE